MWRKLQDGSAPIQYTNVRFYLILFFSLCFKASPRPTSEIDSPAEFPSRRPSGTKKGHQPPNNLLWLFFFLFYDSFHWRCSVCVAVVTACLSCAVSRTPQRINVKKAFIFYFFIFFCAPTYCVGDVHTGDRQRRHEDLIYFCAASTLKWRLNSTDRHRSRPSADIYLASIASQPN